MSNAKIVLFLLQQYFESCGLIFYERSSLNNISAANKSFLASSSEEDPSFSTPALNYDDVYFTIPITVGGQKLEAVPDTGSFSLLVLSSEACPTCPGIEVVETGKERITGSTDSLSEEEATGLAMHSNNEATFLRKKNGANDKLDKNNMDKLDKKFLTSKSIKGTLRIDGSLAAIDGPPVYNSKLSKSYKGIDQYAEITFGSGIVSVKAGVDDVEVGKSMVHGQRLWEITSMDQGMRGIWQQGAQFNAILGLGLADWVPDSKDESTILKNLRIEKFALCLGQEEGDSSTTDSSATTDLISDHQMGKSSGRIYWGEYPELSNEIITLPVVGDKHWAVKLKSYGVTYSKNGDSKNGDGKIKNDQKTHFMLNNSEKKDESLPCSLCAAVVDSGTSAIAVPSMELKRLTEMIGLVKQDCSNVQDLPDITLEFESTASATPDTTLEFKSTTSLIAPVIRIPPESYVKRFVSMSEDPSSSPSGEKCYLSIAETPLERSEKHGGIWILGQPMIEEYLILYDRVKKTMGFSRKGSGCPNLIEEIHNTNLQADLHDEQMESINSDEIVLSRGQHKGVMMRLHKKTLQHKNTVFKTLQQQKKTLQQPSSSKTTDSSTMLGSEVFGFGVVGLPRSYLNGEL